MRATVRRRGPSRWILWWRLPLVLLAALLVAGCAVQLVPAHDPALVEGLSEANRETLELFAAVSGGTTAETFERREATYNRLIGAFDALRLQAGARPVPRPLVLRWLGVGGAEDVEPEEIEKLQNPTPEILATVRDTLIEMRDTDREQGLSALRVTGFKNIYEPSIDQALTVEKAFER